MSDKKANDLKSAAHILKKLAHPVRIGMIRYITENPHCSAGDIQKRVGTSQSMTSQHLSVLKHIGVIDCEKEANTCRFYLKNKGVLRLLDCVFHCATHQNR